MSSPDFDRAVKRSPPFHPLPRPFNNTLLLPSPVRGRHEGPIRTVLVPFDPPTPLLDALRDVRSAVNHLVPDWHAHPEESRFDATKRCYRNLHDRYGHLASKWPVGMCNETSATLNSWDRLLRRQKYEDPEKWARLRKTLPHRQRLKVSLHPDLYRIDRRVGTVLDLTLHRDRHVRIDLSGVKNPLFW